MTYQRLERVGLIEPYQVPQAEIRDLLDVARRDVKTAQELTNIDLDWALIVAYNAALQAGLAFMHAKGYRPRGPDRHKTVIRFLRAALDPSFKPKLNRLDRIRKKRHRPSTAWRGPFPSAKQREPLSLLKNLLPSLPTSFEEGAMPGCRHSAMTRYFMSVTEAVSLIIQAAPLTKGGDLFMLDMGQRIHIDDLARRLIRLRGLRPEVDITHRLHRRPPRREATRT